MFQTTTPQSNMLQDPNQQSQPQSFMNNINTITPEDSETAMNLLSMATSNPQPLMNGNLNETRQDQASVAESSSLARSTEPQTTLQQQQTDMDILLSLMMACRSGDLEEVKRCVSTGRVDFNAHDPKSIYGTPLMKAISNGHLDIVSYLLDAGADVTTMSWDKDSSALHLAIEKKDLEMVKLLLHSGKVDKECKNGHGETAVEYAIRQGSVTIADYVKQYDHDKYLNSRRNEALKRSENQVMADAESPFQQASFYPMKKRK
ncbi:hypothetical protein C9374_000470 [Naegleria lovaniensis]|uniref:Uncharacterized protein n=1 Tax=Naegleria lovaniensis TaxID=51637 RepID=A0AA88GTV3_NAELO|nr:uncharacterized protein C9374_000470 [Naegleria lovaniensis]KAG2388306.1 hypothetical protein C9374_000470 [Naegleria lovaniensis]